LERVNVLVQLGTLQQQPVDHPEQHQQSEESRLWCLEELQNWLR
jgi:hypothetical protein